MPNAQYFKDIIGRIQTIVSNFLKTEMEIEAEAKNALDQAIKKADATKIQIIKNKINNINDL